MTPKSEHNHKPLLIAKILREVLRTEPLETLSDVTDAVKRRCVALKITYTGHDVSRAMELVGSNRALTQPVRLERAVLAFPSAINEGLSASESKRIYDELLTRFQSEHPTSPARDGAPENFPDLVSVPQ